MWLLSKNGLSSSGSSFSQVYPSLKLGSDWEWAGTELAAGYLGLNFLQGLGTGNIELIVGTVEKCWERCGDPENPGKRESKGSAFPAVTVLGPAGTRHHRSSREHATIVRWGLVHQGSRGVWYSCRVIKENPGG